MKEERMRKEWVAWLGNGKKGKHVSREKIKKIKG